MWTLRPFLPSSLCVFCTFLISSQVFQPTLSAHNTTTSVRPRNGLHSESPSSVTLQPFSHETTSELPSIITVGVSTVKIVENGIRPAVSTQVPGGAHGVSDTEGRKQNSPAGTKAAVLIIRLARCRSFCLFQRKHGKHVTKKNGAKRALTTVMSSFNDCWDTCLLLEIESGSNRHPTFSLLSSVVCSSGASVCLPGCQDACKFHERIISEPSSASSLRISNENLIPFNYSVRTSTEGKHGKLFHLALRWRGVAAEVSNKSATVYTVVQWTHLRGISGLSWKMLDQTVKSSLTLTFGEMPRLETIRIFATTPAGLLSLKQKQVDDNGSPALINLSGGGDNMKEKLIKLDDSHWVGQEQKDKVGEGANVWHLRRVSMVYKEPFLVLTQMTWDVPPENSSSLRQTVNMNTRPVCQDDKEGGGKEEEEETLESSKKPRVVVGSEKCGRNMRFLVTWKVLVEASCQGNMITDGNQATLSLHQNTSYIIQVGLLAESSSNLPAGNWTQSQPAPKICLWSDPVLVSTHNDSSLSTASQDPLDPYELPDDATGFEESKDYDYLTELEAEVGSLVGGKCDCRTVETKFKGCCGHGPKGASFLEILGSTYGLLVLLVIAVYLVMVYKNSRFYTSPTRRDELKGSASNIFLLEIPDITTPHPSSGDVNGELTTLT